MGHKILIVDDDRINISLVKFSLSEKRYHVIVASDGEEGIARVNDENPDLIILDVQMPNMNGYEFMCELKSIQGFETTPVIMLTANETLSDVFNLEGVKGYFVKPVNFPDLEKKIVACLGENPVV